MDTGHLLSIFGGEPVSITTTALTSMDTPEGPAQSNYTLVGIFIDCDSKFIYLGPSIEDMTIAVARLHIITIDKITEEEFSAMIGQQIDAPNRKDMN